MNQQGKILSFEKESRQQLIVGAGKLTEAVKVTLGPGGRNVLIEKANGDHQVTKDGVTVAKSINLPDPMEDIGCQMLKEISILTNKNEGDGTTTSLVLGYEILKNGNKAISDGVNGISLKKGIDWARDEIIDKIKELSQPIEGQEQIKNVATISANNDPEIGGHITTALEKVGANGVVTTSLSPTGRTNVTFEEGLSFDKGFMSKYFINTKTATTEMSDPYVLLVDGELSAITDDFVNFFVEYTNSDATKGKPLLIIASGMSQEMLGMFVGNKLKGLMSVCVVEGPGYGNRQSDMMKDLSYVTGSPLISKETAIGFADISPDQLGKVAKITVDHASTIIISKSDRKEQIEDRIKVLRAELEQTTSEYDIEKLQERIAKMSGGVAVINIGGDTSVEQSEIKDRIDDALSATKSAIEGGIVCGGGTTLAHVFKSLTKGDMDDQDAILGYNIVCVSLFTPIRQIIYNIHKDDETTTKIVDDIVGNKYGYGYNGKTLLFTEDMIADGVIDPTRVLIESVKNACSVASMILTTDCVVGIDHDNLMEYHQM